MSDRSRIEGKLSDARDLVANLEDDLKELDEFSYLDSDGDSFILDTDLGTIKVTQDNLTAVVTFDTADQVRLRDFLVERLA